MKIEIKSTKNYDLFELHEFNRDVKRTRELKESIIRHGWIDAYPMHCIKNGNGKCIIKDGHHRFTVARELGIPVKYVVCDDEATMQELIPTVRSWSIKDILDSHYRSSSIPYITVKDYQELTGLPIGICVSLLGGDSAGSGNYNKPFKQGTFRLGDTAHAYDVADVVTEMRSLNIPFATLNLFAVALSKALRVKQFNKHTFVDRVKANPGLMIKQSSADGYLELIERVYNHASGKKNRLPVAFLAKEAARERCAVNVGNAKK